MMSAHKLTIKPAYLADRPETSRPACTIFVASTTRVISKPDLSTYNPLRDKLCDWQAQADADGRVAPPDGPGLGVNIDEAMLADFPLIDGPGYI